MLNILPFFKPQPILFSKNNKKAAADWQGKFSTGFSIKYEKYFQYLYDNIFSGYCQSTRLKKVPEFQYRL